jgi:hypothetical protein
MSSDQGSARPLHRERRKYPRKRVFIPVEMYVDGDSHAIHTNVTNLNIGGCFLKMVFSLVPGTGLRLSLALPDGRVNTTGLVVSRSRNLGNGVKFTEISSEHKEKLEHFVASGPVEGSTAMPS